MLSVEERVRFARHRALAVLGDAGQRALLDGSPGAPLADPGAEAIRARYLACAGVPGRAAGEPRNADVAVLAGAAHLVPAAEALLGAFEAVERVKALAGFGEPASIPGGFTLADKESP